MITIWREKVQFIEAKSFIYTLFIGLDDFQNDEGKCHKYNFFMISRAEIWFKQDN